MSDYFFYFAYYYLYYLLITQSLFMSTILPTAMYLENKYVLFAEIKKVTYIFLLCVYADNKNLRHKNGIPWADFRGSGPKAHYN